MPDEHIDEYMEYIMMVRLCKQTFRHRPIRSRANKLNEFVGNAVCLRSLTAAFDRVLMGDFILIVDSNIKVQDSWQTGAVSTGSSTL